jgi:hypothetical protein
MGDFIDEEVDMFREVDGVVGRWIREWEEREGGDVEGGGMEGGDAEGRDVEGAKFCTQCGAKRNGGGKFCSECGEKF